MLNTSGFVYNTEQEQYNFLIEAIVKPSSSFKKLFEDKYTNLHDNDSNQSIYTKSDGDSNNALNLAVIRRFDFCSELQRMSVIVRGLNDSQFRVFCKGSPEKIKELSLPSSIPNNFHKILTNYTQNGLRVLGLGCKVLPKMSYETLQSKTRNEFEYD